MRHALSSFDRKGLLDSFHTTFAWPASCGALFTPGFRKSLERRSYPIDWKKIRTHQPFSELARLLRVPWASDIDEIYTSLDRRVAELLLRKKIAPKVIYAYEDGASHSFEAARAAGIKTLYDLPIGHYLAAQKIFKEEAEAKPEWASTLTGLTDSPEKLERKSQELKLADHVVVASQFTASTLAGLLSSAQKISIVPYGAPRTTTLPVRGINNKLKVLYVGSLTQRKGISYLFSAVDYLKKYVELTVIGRHAAPCLALERSLVPHRYIPTLAHADLLLEMRAHDILVFPSLFEGFGLVLTEALSCGLPFISTANTAAPDLITDGVEGFIVPIRSAGAIAEKLTWAIENRAALAAMQNAAFEKAKTLGWNNYEEALITIANAYVA